MGVHTDSYLTWLRASGISPATARLREHYLRRLETSHPTRDLLTLDQDELATFLAHPSWAPETRKSARAAVRGFYGWATETDRITTNPARSLATVRVPLGQPNPAPDNVWQRALLTAKPRERLMLLLAGYAGLRRGEIAKVHTRDVAGGSLRVTGKGQRVRQVPLHPVLLDSLSALPEGYAFPGRDDGHLSPGAVGKLLAELLGPGWSAHKVRHRFATRAYAGQRDILAVGQLLGHSKPETTQRYVALPEDALRLAVMAAGEVA